MRFRLIMPTLRSPHAPEFTARGVSLGVGLAFTPLIGIQMPLVVLLWILVRRFAPRWDFHLLIALAWTWVTNVATLVPVYYVFYVTGRVMLWRWDALPGFSTFATQMRAMTQIEASWLEAFWITLVRMFETWGEPMFIGSLPYAIGLGWLSYRWSLRLIRRLRARRDSRRARRRSAATKTPYADGEGSSGRP